MRGRTPSERSKYYIPNPCYRLSVEYALNYDIWQAEIKSLRNQAKGIRYDKDKVQSSGDYNPTEAAGIRITELQEKVDKIDKALQEAAGDMEDYIRLNVCNGFTYYQLVHGYHMPLNKNEFGDIRQHFYYVLYHSL